MANYDFGEKRSEKINGKEFYVILTEKYSEAKAKAIELIEKGDYGLTIGDFWILKNKSKNGYLLYSGLIMSHNGCLKVNEALPAEKKFRPDCIHLDKEGYNNSLVYTYICADQKIAEVGEVSAKNCANDYPYAMALKRCMDRVILKNSKIAFSGILSEVESDEFKREFKEQKPDPVELPPMEQTPAPFTCSNCGSPILEKEYKYSMTNFKIPLCRDCQRL